MDSFFILSHSYVVKRKEERRINFQKGLFIVLMACAGLYAWAKPPEIKEAEPTPQPCPLYYASEINHLEGKLNWLRKENKRLAALSNSQKVSNRKEEEKMIKNQGAFLIPAKRAANTLIIPTWQKNIVKPIQTACKLRGIPAKNCLFIIAHAKLENGCNPRPLGLNIWNIKGRGIRLKTIEYYNGRKCFVTDSFRAYPSVDAAVDDYLNFLAANYPQAYNALFDSKATVKNFYKGLDHGKYGKYATDIFYHAKFRGVYKSLKSQFSAS